MFWKEKTLLDKIYQYMWMNSMWFLYCMLHIAILILQLDLETIYIDLSQIEWHIHHVQVATNQLENIDPT